MIILHNAPSCTSCRKAKTWFEDYQIPYTERDIIKDPLTKEEIKQMLMRTENGTEDLISTRSKAFKELNINVEELTLKELIELVGKNPAILKRPLIADETRFQVGFNENEIRRFLPREIRAYELEKAKQEAGIV